MVIHERKMIFGGDNDDGLGEKLIQQVLDGIKTATCDLKSFCTAQEIADLDAETGWFETVVDANGNARCNIQITAVFETTIGNPDLRLVRGEGDGEDVEKFQRDHHEWFDALLEIKGLSPLTDEAILIAWVFELVEVP